MGTNMAYKFGKPGAFEPFFIFFFFLKLYVTTTNSSFTVFIFLQECVFLFLENKNWRKKCSPFLLVTKLIILIRFAKRHDHAHSLKSHKTSKTCFPHLVMRKTAPILIALISLPPRVARRANCKQNTLSRTHLIQLFPGCCEQVNCCYW